MSDVIRLPFVEDAACRFQLSESEFLEVDIAELELEFEVVSADKKTVYDCLPGVIEFIERRYGKKLPLSQAWALYRWATPKFNEFVKKLEASSMLPPSSASTQGQSTDARPSSLGASVVE